MENTQLSEIARIREQIEAECQALYHLQSLPAMCASHEIIQTRYKALDSYHEQLKGVVGESVATETVVTIYNKEVQ